LIANSKFGQQEVNRRADTGKSAFWSAARLTAAGDTVLIYVEHPV